MRRLLLLSLLALSGCASPATVDNAEFPIRYWRDVNTDLCFAYIWSSTHGGWQVVSFTHVPMAACERRP